MTDKELRKLGRRDLLTLLVTNEQEKQNLIHSLGEGQEREEQLQSTVDRLKIKLNEKDQQIQRLIKKLNEKDMEIAEMEKAGKREYLKGAVDSGELLQNTVDAILALGQDLSEKIHESEQIHAQESEDETPAL